MKKAIAILILAAVLSGCAQSAEPSAEVVTMTSSSAITSTEREKLSENVTAAESKSTTTRRTTTQTSAVTTTAASAATTAHTVPTSATKRTSRETTQPSESKPVLAQYEPVRATTTMTTTAAPITEQPRETTTAMQTTQSVATTSTRAVTTTKPKATTKQTTTTAKPKTTTASKKETVPKPPIITKTTTTVIENGITYVEVPDITCLATMIENLEETDTPPIYYMQIGKGLKHDGTDYGKAVAVFRWMEDNGWGSCVYHSLETYYVCQGIGLECAYAFCTDNGWYGHTFNVVKVEGKWYALDTQAGIFLDNWPYVCKRMFDGMDRDLPPFDEDVFYPYDEDGEFRNWLIEYVE